MQAVKQASLEKFILLSLFAFLSVTGQGQNKVLYYADMPPDFAASKISKHLLAEDMKWWQTVMEESHVNPYHAITKAGLWQLQKQLLSRLPDSVTHAEASFAVSELIGALNEGHLGLATDPASDSIYAYHAIRFPYLLGDIDSGYFVVQRDLSNLNKLPPFSCILQVNGIPVQQLYDKYSRFYGGLNPWRKLMVKNNIRKLLFMDGIYSPFTIKAVVEKDTLEFTVGGYSRTEADSLNKVLAASVSGGKPFSLTFSGDSIAQIEFNTMNGRLQDSFALFLRRSFAEIQQRNAKGLLIDLRKNGGGNSDLGDLLLGYITDRSYRNVSGVKMRISKHSKAYAKLSGADDSFKNWKDGKLYEHKVEKLTRPVANDLRFGGRVAVLIGTGTFSSANMLTNAIKDYGLATLVGESTAEPGNDFGEIFSFMLPHTHIVANGAFKMFTRANGNEKDFDGIKPDIEVKYSSHDLEMKKDKVVEKAMEFVSGR